MTPDMITCSCFTAREDKNTKFTNPMKVITGPNTRWSYANVWEPKSINGGAPKYSVSLIIPKSDTKTVAKIQAAIEAAYREGESKLKGNGKSVPALSAIKTPLRDGDTERPDDPAYLAYSDRKQTTIWNFAKPKRNANHPTSKPLDLLGYRWEGDHLVVEPEEAKIVRLIYDNFLKGLSAEATEKQLEEMGVKSMKGMHFPNSSIRAILKNITYTGNLLFQKEYTLDPISKKTRKNHGELPQYFVENAHEAIIPMETYQAVQAEIARRRELGALANWSINTSCFTSKIKCGLCGASFVRNTRKNRAKTSQLGERYTFYGCGTNKRKGEHCSSGTIREDVLKEECAKVLGLPEFDEQTFSEQVEKITIPATGTMLFEFTDGSSLEHHWSRNAKKESWTAERRKAVSEYRRSRETGWKCYHAFTHFIKCGRCGANYRCQTHKRVDGTVVRSWYCSSPTAVGCSKVGIREDTLKALIADVIGLPEFDEELFNQQLAYATVPADNQIVFHFRDGHEASRTFVQKRQMPRQTEERKKHMSEVMKANWRERHAEND